VYKKGAHIIWEVDGAEQKVGHLFSFLKQPRNRFLGRHTARTSVYLENYSSILNTCCSRLKIVGHPFLPPLSPLRAHPPVLYYIATDAKSTEVDGMQAFFTKASGTYIVNYFSFFDADEFYAGKDLVH
jgi:hypothetical protein